MPVSRRQAKRKREDNATTVDRRRGSPSTTTSSSSSAVFSPPVGKRARCTNSPLPQDSPLDNDINSSLSIEIVDSSGDKTSRTKNLTTRTLMTSSAKRKKKKNRSLSSSRRFKPRFDPIMLTPLTTEPFFWYTFRRPNGTSTIYDVRTLAKYLLVSGEFKEPVTRIPFQESDLRAMDKQLVQVLEFYQRKPQTRGHGKAQKQSIEAWFINRAEERLSKMNSSIKNINDSQSDSDTKQQDRRPIHSSDTNRSPLVIVEDSPVVERLDPVENSQAPVENSQAPVENSEIPVENSQAPVESSEIPEISSQPTPTSSILLVRNNDTDDHDDSMFQLGNLSGSPSNQQSSTSLLMRRGASPSPTALMQRSSSGGASPSPTALMQRSSSGGASPSPTALIQRSSSVLTHSSHRLSSQKLKKMKKKLGLTRFDIASAYDHNSKRNLVSKLFRDDAMGLVMEAYRCPDKYNEEKFRQNALLGLERATGEKIEDMFAVVEGLLDPEYAQIHLFTNVFPNFTYYFTQLREADPKYASQTLMHYINMIKGPEKQPIPDVMGFKAPIIDFLSSHLSPTASQ